MIVLAAKKRDANESLNVIRESSRIPAVLYGLKTESQQIVVDYQEFRKVLREVELHKVFELELDGKKMKALVKDFSRHKVRDTYEHIDFYAVEEKQAVIVPVPVEFSGESAAVRIGAMLTVAMPRIKVKALPNAIPEVITVDISSLKADGDKVAVADIAAIEGVTFEVQPSTMIVKAEMSRASKKAANEAGDDAAEESTEEAAAE